MFQEKITATSMTSVHRIFPSSRNRRSPTRPASGALPAQAMNATLLYRSRYHTDIRSGGRRGAEFMHEQGTYRWFTKPIRRSERAMSLVYSPCLPKTCDGLLLGRPT